MRNLLKLVFQRVVAVSFGIALQIIFLIVMATYLRTDFFWIRIAMNVLSWAVVIYIISCGVNPSYKIAWIVLILAFPVAGLTIYLLFGGNKISSYEHRKMQSIEAVTMQQLRQDEAPLWELAAAETPAFNHARYLLSASGYPIYDDADAEYFPSGESCYAAMLEEIKKAERYIFIEFFIIATGKMWDPMLELLRQKAAAGVDVRVVYDDFGCITRLPMGYAKKLREMGIRAHAFNPYIPILSARLNNRDHRKLLIIDGKAAFTGGVNLADEYINKEERFGKWKDNCFLLQGDAVRNYTLMFLQLWNTTVSQDAKLYQPYVSVRSDRVPREGDGFIIPYGDGPHSPVSVAQSIYLNIIHSAVDYVHIMTPYLVLDDEMLNALKRAAKSGIDVRILLPYIPDKKTVNLIGKTYYPELLEAGVHIYEYTPGFVHSKVVEADGNIAAVGTINLDFRSLYLHYECACLIFENDVLKDITEDFHRTFADSHRITMSDYKKMNLMKRFAGRVLRVFAPQV